MQIDECFQSIIKKQRFMILDGGFGTECKQNGAKIDDDLWSARLIYQNPELIEKVHYDFFEAGADIAITSTYQASLQGFLKKGFDIDQSIQLFHKSIILAKSARDRFWDTNKGNSRCKPLIAVSVGCYGAYLPDGQEYTGKYDLDKVGLMNWHRERLQILVQTGIDLFACETIPCMDEAEALVQVLKEFPNIKAWMCFSCKDEKHLNSGELFSQVIDLIQRLDQEQQIIAFGINCTKPQYVSSLLDEANKVITNKNRVIVVYANNGQVWDGPNHQWLEETGIQNDIQYSNYAKQWYDQGARAIGGCCKIRPSTIKKLREDLEFHVNKLFEGELQC